MIDYVIVIPSKGRSSLVGSTLRLLPTAKVWVDEREANEYGLALPKNQLVLHRPTEGIVQCRNELLTTFSKAHECVVMVDDDLIGIRCLVGRRPRSTTDPHAIRQVIENSITICTDLGIKAFCWNRNPNPMQFLGHDPLAFVPPLAGAWGVIGEPRLADRRLKHQEDLDITMQYLLHDRIIYSDRRWYFDFGATWGNKGGNQAARRFDAEQDDTRLLKQKWGRYIRIEGRKSGTTRRLSIRVKRRSHVAAYK